MYIASRVLFFLSLFGLSISLAVPNFSRAMSWQEAVPGVFVGLFLCSVFALLCVVFTPGRLAQDAVARGHHRRRWGILLGAIGVGYCLTFGVTVAAACQHRINAENRGSALRSLGAPPSYRSGYRSSGYDAGYDAEASLARSYAHQDRYGRDLGVITAGTTILPLAFLIFALLWKPKPATVAYAPMPPGYQPSWPPAAHAGPNPYAPTLYGGVPPVPLAPQAGGFYPGQGGSGSSGPQGQ